MFVTMLRASLLFSSRENNIKIYRKESAWKGVDAIRQVQDKGPYPASKNCETKFCAQYAAILLCFQDVSGPNIGQNIMHDISNSLLTL